MYQFFAIFQSHTTKLITHLILLITAVLELHSTVLEEILGVDIRIHYGVFIYCVVRIFETIAKILEDFQS